MYQQYILFHIFFYNRFKYISFLDHRIYYRNYCDLRNACFQKCLDKFNLSSTGPEARKVLSNTVKRINLIYNWLIIVETTNDKKVIP